MRPLLLLLALSACAAAGPSGRFIGDVVPTSSGPTCLRSRGTAQIDRGSVTFAPNDGTWILSGSAEPNGTIDAERIQPGANKQPYETRLAGRWTEQSITGTYITPRCTFDVRLARR